MSLRTDAKACYGVIILAAGSSKRMGSTNKLLAVLPDGPRESILKSSTKHALSAIEHDKCPGYLMVVTGHAHADVQKELSSLFVECVYNSDAGSGMASSLQVGLEHLQQKANQENKHLDFIVVCLGDMPHVQPETIVQLIDARLDDTQRDFIVPVTNGQRGNPVLIGHPFFDKINELTGDVGARRLIQKNPAATYELVVSDSAILKDYDVPSDFT